MRRGEWQLAGEALAGEAPAEPKKNVLEVYSL